MDILPQLIGVLNKEDIRYFKLFASRFDTGDARKDIQLFDYIKKSGEQYEEEKIVEQLGYKDKNAFYRLRHRLIEDIGKSLVIQHYDDNEMMYIFHCLSLEKYFFGKNNFRLALRFLKKAETEAQKIENYELLDLVYGEYINLSHEIVSIDPEEYIGKRRKNREQLNLFRQIGDIVAAVNYRLKITQNFDGHEAPVLKLLEKTVSEFSHDPSIRKSPKLKFQIYSAVSKILLQRRDYKTLENYLLKTYKQFEKEQLFNKASHDIKLQMLSYIVNALFKNSKIKASLEYAEKLKKAMEEYNSIRYDKYLFFYYNSLVINYSVLDKDKAISILEELKNNEQLKKSSFYELFVYLNLAILWFDKGEFHKSIKNLNKLYLHHNYKNTDHALKFKIAIAELMIRYELQDFDFLEHKIGQIKKEYRVFFPREEHNREKRFIQLLDEMIITDSILKDKTLLKKINEFIRDRENTQDDAEIINYNDWLKSKIAPAGRS